MNTDILAIASVTATVIFALNGNEITATQVQTTEFTSYAIKEVSTMNYTASLIGSPEVKRIKTCDDVTFLIQDLQIPDLEIIEDIEKPQTKYQINCLVKVGDSISSVKVYKTI